MGRLHQNGGAALSAVSPHYTSELTSWAVSVLGARMRAPGSEWADFKCRAHSDKSASASINLQNGWVQCQADGCGASCWADQYAERYGVPAPPKKTTTKPKTSSKTTRTEYVYENVQGNPYMKTLKKSKPDGSKDFRQARFEGGKWVWGLGGTDAILYRLPQLIASDCPVLLVEGEKDVLAAERLGFTATTAPMGAGKAHKVKDWTALAGRDVILLPDNDDPGRRHMAQVADLLEGIAASVRTLELPGLPEKGDLSDWVALGGTREKLQALIEQTERTQEAPADEWDPLTPLDSWDTPDWPAGLLPESLEQFAEAVAEMNQTSPSQGKMTSIPVLSAACQDRFQVALQGRKENLATFTCVANGTGERKTSDEKHFKRPLAEFQTKSLAATLEKRREDELRRRFLRARVDKLEKIAVNSGEGDDFKAFEAAQQELDRLGDITPKRVIAMDITPEKLASLMWEQGGNIAILSAEGGQVEKVRGEYQRAALVANIFLQGSAGEDFLVDRKGCDPITVESPSLTMGIMTQPGHLQSILADKDFQGRGLLERFLWCMPAERIGYRRRGRPIPSGLAESYRRTLTAMLPEPGYRVPGDRVERVTLYVEGVGAEACDAFEFERLEPRLRKDGDLRDLKGWATRLPTAVIKLAALWHIYHSLDQGDTVPEIVASKWVVNAIRWVEEFAIPMGLKTFGLMGADPGGDMAGRILTEIRKHRYTEFRKADFKQKHFKGTPAPEVDKGYQALVERNFLRKKRIPTSGRTAVVFEVNPATFTLGEEGRRRERKGPGSAFDTPTEALHSDHLLNPYKVILDPSSSLKNTDSIGETDIEVPTSGIKGIKERKGPVDDSEASLSDLLEEVL